MTTDPLRAALRELIAAYADVTDDAAPLDLDSLSLIQLTEEIEARFGLVVAAADLVPAHFASVDAMAAYLGGRGATAPPAL